MFGLSIPWYYKALAIIGIVIATYFYGRHDGVQISKTAIAQYEALKKNTDLKIKELTDNVKERVVVQYVDRIKTIQKKEIVYVKVAETVPDKFEFSNGWVSVHDSAARGDDADSSAALDATSSGVKANEGLALISQNYSICKQNAEQLNSALIILREYDKIISDHNKSLKH